MPLSLVTIRLFAVVPRGTPTRDRPFPSLAAAMAAIPLLFRSRAEAKRHQTPGTVVREVWCSTED